MREAGEAGEAETGGWSERPKRGVVSGNLPELGRRIAAPVLEALE